MAYPAGWLTRSSGNTRFLSELDEDHNKPWQFRTGPRPSKGFEVSLTTVSKRAIRRYSTRDLDAVMRIWKGFYALEVPSESNVEQMFLGEPARRGTGTLGFGQVVNCIVGQNPELIFLLCLLAPSEQALHEFMPTWEQMLASVTPTLKGDISTCQGFLYVADVEGIVGSTDIRVETPQVIDGVSCGIVAGTSDQTQSLVLLITRHDTVEAAEKAYRELVDIFHDQPAFKEGALGPNSFEVMEDIIATGELTPAVGLLEGTIILNITDNGGERPFIDSMDRLLELARMVRQRLP